MVSIQNAKMYSEVYNMLNFLGDEYKNLLPQKLYNFIKENKLENNIQSNNENLQPNISKESIAFICMLHCKYWCKTEEEKAKINKILEYNEKKKREKYFEFEKKMENEKYAKTEEKALVVINKKNIFQRILNFFKNLKF